MRRVWKGKQRAMDGDDEVIADSEDEDVKRAVREAVPQELERLEMKKVRPRLSLLSKLTRS